MNMSPTLERPSKFESAESVLIVRLRRAPQDFVRTPRKSPSRLETADGKASRGAIAARFQSRKAKGNQVDVTKDYSQEKKNGCRGRRGVPFCRTSTDFKKTKVPANGLSQSSPFVDGRRKAQVCWILFAPCGEHRLYGPGRTAHRLDQCLSRSRWEIENGRRFQFGEWQL